MIKTSPEIAIKALEDKYAKLEKTVKDKDKLIVSNTREIGKLRNELKRLITRMNTNEADVRHLNSKR